MMNINHLEVETEDAFNSLLELAANNDLDAFKKHIDRKPSIVDEIGLWYGRQKGSNQMVLHHRTPLMVAATYGSIDVLKLIISLPEVDVNRACGNDQYTPLHCAASGGSINAIDAVKILLAVGADPNLCDANGHRPIDVIVVPPKLQGIKCALQMMLMTDMPLGESNSNSPSLSESQPENRAKPSDVLEASASDVLEASTPEKKGYPIDPSLPNINNSIYSTDEFRMFSFKVRPCSRAYSHDWTECPFVHPGENARRRDPRKYHYSCVPCPDFRKGACRRGDMCEYAHGVFECWLHPAQYRTRLCKDGSGCNRRVCFFAHAQDELRPLYVSTGSGVPSPRLGANVMDFVGLLPSSPSAGPGSPFTPPMSPSTNGISGPWGPQQNVPTLHLPGSNLQSSRLRSSFNARDIQDVDLHLLSEMSILSPQQNVNNRCARSRALTSPSNLDDIFFAESSSPRYSHKSTILNQFQQQQQNMLSPIKTNYADHSLLQASYSGPSTSRMSPHSVDPISPMSAHLSMLSRHDMQSQQFRSLSSRDLGSNSEESWSKWAAPTGLPEWGISGSETGNKLKRSSSFEVLNNGEEPDLSWVQSLVKESPQDVMEKSAVVAADAGTSYSEDANLDSSQIEQVDQSVLGAWLEQMQLDQLMAQ